LNRLKEVEEVDKREGEKKNKKKRKESSLKKDTRKESQVICHSL
jgi:hypothetical protein